MDIKKFGAYISKLRKEHDLTQSKLAESLNVTRQAVSKWEMGDSFPDIRYYRSYLKFLASALINS
ncbi:helix-turn-helix transcriptional regulator [Paenibacillus sp. LHD-38]|uniref:helix-turn-helix transcriptional regulator n=1 Tax=Paenibacillus sp. LHD-38 TaxID=3072143 RepID=UPI0035BE7FE3